ncbi:conserved hypothetical protein [Burkholderiales bacterium 8X]|nr:conserved hypothetical protein [Burkholderiales bacterium 8X]
MSAFVFAELAVTDKAMYRDEYVPRATRAVAAFGGKFVGTGRRVAFHIGMASPSSRAVLIEFPSFEMANAFYESSAYREASSIRERCATTFKYVILDADADALPGGQGGDASQKIAP